MSLPGGDRSRLAWWTLGLVIGAALAFVAWSFVGTFVFGVFIYYATRPVYKRVKRRVRPRSLAAAVSLLLVAMPAVLLLAYSLAVGIQEFGRLAETTDLGTLDPYVQPYFNVSQLTLTPEEIAGSGGLSAIASALDSATAYLGVLALGFLHLFVMIAIAFYLLRDDHLLSRWVLHRFGDDTGVLEAYFEAIDRSFHQVFFGNILNAVITGVIGAFAYGLLDLFAPAGGGIPYPTLLGLLAGLASLVPIVGMKLVYVPAAVYLFGAALLSDAGTGLGFPTAFTLVSFVVVDTIPDLVLRPYVSGRNLHVGMVMFAYVLGPLLFGWYGLFLGPMILVVAVHFVRIVLPELVAGTPIRPAGIDPGNATDLGTTPPGDGSGVASDESGPAGDPAPDGGGGNPDAGG
ncbi:MAG: AI-2E family transporter [Halobacteriales archaeon]